MKKVKNFIIMVRKYNKIINKQTVFQENMKLSKMIKLNRKLIKKTVLIILI